MNAAPFTDLDRSIGSPLGDFRGVIFVNTSFGHRSADAGSLIALRPRRTTVPRRPTSPAREADVDKREHTFAAVRAIGRALPDVEVTTAWGEPALSDAGSPRGAARPSPGRG